MKRKILKSQKPLSTLYCVNLKTRENESSNFFPPIWYSALLLLLFLALSLSPRKCSLEPFQPLSLCPVTVAFKVIMIMDNDGGEGRSNG